MSHRIHNVGTNLLLGMIAAGSNHGSYLFPTPGGRPCLLSLTIGEDAVAVHAAILEQLTKEPDAQEPE